MSFIHLQVYSAYSLLTSTASVPELIRQAKQCGFRALALTDRNVMYGAIEFYKLCKNQNIKPIIGLTADITSLRGENESFPLVLLAENDEGFKNLLKISSAIQTKAENGLPLKWLKSYAKGLIALTPGSKGEIEQALLKDDTVAAREMIQQLNAIFGSGSFFLSLQNHHLGIETTLRKQLYTISKEMNIPLAATTCKVGS